MLILIIKDRRLKETKNLYERIYENKASNLKTIIKYIKEKTSLDVFIFKVHQKDLLIAFYI